ncbi:MULTISPECIES: hypothetical protein [Aeromonas]|uniref:hypothetical protein n=1 Tax=Aeromonas TaxID=642 RepID=UPI000852599F|nr:MULTISPECIES: hypothetical protein [Aeromonas]MCE9863739.1 hypothetical protein [Aeromonas caviae]MDH0027612.1 hypothetical protein [Aeromonas caviae]MDH1078442.1 hypothetical protein [Aeromonas caviae]MDH1845380.1 hypothetical protein [Aeromonas caviae]MDX7724238.1 hypothetical protein [Aeromonas caviae]
MATFKFYIPAINLMGAGCLQEAAADIQGHGYRKALIVTCSPPRILKKTSVKNEKRTKARFMHFSPAVNTSLKAV